MARIDWPQLMRLGLGQLRLSPTEFWAMTPPELFAAAEGAGLIPLRGTAGFGRDSLTALMARFPDSVLDTDPGEIDAELPE